MTEREQICELIAGIRTAAGRRRHRRMPTAVHRDSEYQVFGKTLGSRKVRKMFTRYARGMHPDRGVDHHRRR